MTIEQDWHQWRARGIGGSDIPAILGLSSYGSPYTVWASKAGLLPPTEHTQRQRIGLRMESVLAEEFHDETGLYVAGEQTWCQHPDMPWARCTVDGFVTETLGVGAGGKLYVEYLDGLSYKFRELEQLGTWQAKTDGRFGWPDGIPPNIRAQCIWEMGVTGLRHCWLTVMFAGFRISTFEIDWSDTDVEADWQLMVRRAGVLWNDHIRTGIPPAVDGSDATADALRTIYPEHQPGEEVALDELAAELTERSDLKGRVKADQARLAEIDNAIKERMRDAEVGTVAGLPLLTYRSSERAGYTVAPTTVRTLRAAPKVKQRKGS